MAEPLAAESLAAVLGVVVSVLSVIVQTGIYFNSAAHTSRDVQVIAENVRATETTLRSLEADIGNFRRSNQFYSSWSDPAKSVVEEVKTTVEELNRRLPRLQTNGKLSTIEQKKWPLAREETMLLLARLKVLEQKLTLIKGALAQGSMLAVQDTVKGIEEISLRAETLPSSRAQQSFVAPPHDPQMDILYLEYAKDSDKSLPKTGDDQREGLETVTEGYSAVVDIVFVHGLGGNSETSWKASNGVSWLHDLLPYDLQNARIMNFDYDPRRYNLVAQPLAAIAKDLSRELWEARVATEASTRPLIFIAHSLGGLIVKHALLDSAYELEHDPAKDAGFLLKSTHSVIFFGTPHQGVNRTPLLQWLNINAERYPKGFLQSFRWTDMQQAQYMKISGNFSTISFHETLRTQTTGQHALMMPQSATEGSGTVNEGLNTNHRDLVKFKSKYDVEYRQVLARLQTEIAHITDQVIEIQIANSRDDLADGDDSSSFRDSAYETWSATDSVQGIISLPGVREEMLDILINDASLGRCGQEVLQDLDADKFVNLFKALLETFARELRDEAEGKEQRGAAHVFWRNAAYAAKCACEYWSGVESSKMTELLAQLPEKKIQLDHILQQISPLTSPEDIPDKNSDTGNDWEDQDLEDIQEPVHLKRLEDFITNSSAFGNLRAELRKMARPNTSTRATEIDYDVLFTKPLMSAVQDLCKRAVEHAAGTKLSWWPLIEPEQELRPNYTRIYSQLYIGSSRANACFHDDIPTPLAEKLFPALTATRDIAQNWPWMPHREANNSKAVLLRGTTLMRVLYEASEQRRNLTDSDRSTKHNNTTVEFSDEQDRHEMGPKVESDYTRAGDRVTASSSRSRGKHSMTLNDGQDIEMTPTVDKPATTRQEGSEGNGGGNDRRGSREDRERNDGQEPKRNSSADDSGTTSGEGCSGESNPVLFLSLDIIKNDSRACSVDVGEKDYDTMKNLYRSYKDLRSSNFWNYKRPTGVKFYRFRSFISKEKRRYRVDIHRETEEYPPETDKTYEWKLEDEDGKMYPNGETWHFLNNPEDCGTSAILKEMLPKKIKDENKSRMTMYGIYIEQQHSVWQIFIPVLLVLGVTLGGTLWFIFPWLKDHHDDLQNATVPVMLALAVVQFILTFLTSLIIFRWSL